MKHRTQQQHSHSFDVVHPASQDIAANNLASIQAV